MVHGFDAPATHSRWPCTKSTIACTRSQPGVSAPKRSHASLPSSSGRQKRLGMTYAMSASGSAMIGVSIVPCATTSAGDVRRTSASYTSRDAPAAIVTRSQRLA